MREGEVRDQNLLELAQELRLAEDLDGSPMLGRPLPHRLRNFRPSVDSFVVSLGGPPAYMRRLREIELETAAHERTLEVAWRSLGESTADAEAFARGWTAAAERWRFDAINELIDKHNRYYPAESRLPMDPRTGDFVLVAGRPYRKQPLDVQWILERFPAVLALAREATLAAPPSGRAVARAAATP
jgi:hypothetical protein